MKKAFRFLSSKFSAKPQNIDRLFISTFLVINEITISKNLLLKKYIIAPSNKTEYEKLTAFVEIIREEAPTFSIENLIRLFEYVISPADRTVNGAVYTPEEIRSYIFNECFNISDELSEKLTISDVACGCGSFLYTAAKEIKKKSKKTYAEIYRNQIFGLDIAEYSVLRAKLLLSVLAASEGEDVREFHFNLYRGDALVFNWRKRIKSFQGFDIVVGNPPYVCSRHLSELTKKRLKKWSVCNSGHPDLYIPFFQIGIDLLSNTGVLGFITMNSFLKSLNGRSLREYFKAKALEFRIVDFGTQQIFKSKYTYTCVCIIENRKTNKIKYYRASTAADLPNTSAGFFSISYNKLNSRNGWNLFNHEIISKIENTGSPLGELYRTRNGIATLKNHIYIFEPVDADRNFYYLKNGSVFPIEKGVCRDILNSNSLYEMSDSAIKEKIIFPYSNDKKPRLLSESFFRDEYPMAYSYLKAKRSILSTRDKGKAKYEKWFAFGRTQSLEEMRYKLFFPHFSATPPKVQISSDEKLLFYNGLALLGNTLDELKLMEKIFQSKVFWFYIKNTSKPYTSGYFSLSSNYIRNFGICEFTKDEVEYVLKETNRDALDAFIQNKYDVKIDVIA